MPEDTMHIAQEWGVGEAGYTISYCGELFSQWMVYQNVIIPPHVLDTENQEIDGANCAVCQAAYNAEFQPLPI